MRNPAALLKPPALNDGGHTAYVSPQLHETTCSALHVTSSAASSRSRSVPKTASLGCTASTYVSEGDPAEGRQRVRRATRTLLSQDVRNTRARRHD